MTEVKKMAKKLTDKVSWVGKVDWELTRFHGDEYSTHNGSSYNSYLVRDKKTALIDMMTMWYSPSSTGRKSRYRE